MALARFLFSEWLELNDLYLRDRLVFPLEQPECNAVGGIIGLFINILIGLVVSQFFELRTVIR